MNAAALLAAETAHQGRDLPVEPWVYGVVAMGILIALLVVTLAFGKDR